jgi:hypothetical protein
MQQTLGSFFIENSSLHKNDFLRIRFDMNNEEDADAIMGNDIYLPLKILLGYGESRKRIDVVEG